MQETKAAKQTERKSTEKKIEKEEERKRGRKKKTKKWYRKKFAKPLSKEYTLFSLAGDLSETLSKWFTDHSNRRTFKIKDTWSLLEPSIYFKSYDLESGHNPCFPTFSYFSIHKYRYLLLFTSHFFLIILFLSFLLFQNI